MRTHPCRIANFTVLPYPQVWHCGSRCIHDRTGNNYHISGSRTGEVSHSLLDKSQGNVLMTPFHRRESKILSHVTRVGNMIRRRQTRKEGEEMRWDILCECCKIHFRQLKTVSPPHPCWKGDGVQEWDIRTWMDFVLAEDFTSFIRTEEWMIQYIL